MGMATVYVISDKPGCGKEDPFELKSEDVSLNAICRNIEIDLRK